MNHTRRELHALLRLLEERDAFLTAIPACGCPGGPCVPHALAWIRERTHPVSPLPASMQTPDWVLCPGHPAHAAYMARYPCCVNAGQPGRGSCACCCHAMLESDVPCPAP